MKKSLINKIYIPIVLFLIIQKFVPSEAFFVIGLLYVIYLTLFDNKSKIFLPFREYKILIILLVWGSLIGVIRLMDNNNSLVIDWVRDVFYYMNPLVFLYIGSYYSKKEMNINCIFNSFIISGGILSFLQLITLLHTTNSLNITNNVYNWRNITGTGVLVSALSLAIIASGIIPKEEKIPGILLKIITIIMIIEFAISLSRTNILIAIITYIVLGYNGLSKKRRISGSKIVASFVIISIFIGIILVFIPSKIREAYVEKIFSSFSEISSNHEWNTTAEVQKNWRGYETYCATKEWKEADPISKVFGFGFGKRIYVGEFAYQLLRQTNSYGKAETTIAVLHNGYATMLIKQGVLGVIVYVLLYVSLFNKGYKEFFKEKNTESKVLIAISIIMLFQTYYLNGLFKDYCFYPLIILMGYSSYKIEKNKKDIH